MAILTLDYRHCERKRPQFIKHLEIEAISALARQQLVESSVDAIAFDTLRLIKGLKIKWFRWHDSGDIQGPAHLARIAKIAEACPTTRFWLPTREKVFVYSHLRQVGAFPTNLVVRVSGAMIDGPPPEQTTKWRQPLSSHGYWLASRASLRASS